jgi:pyruvate formate lyase activating enzyme
MLYSKYMARCRVCNIEGRAISSEIGVCYHCLRHSFEKAQDYIFRAHILSRKFFKLPETVPLSKDGIACANCVNTCRLTQGESGFCSVRNNRNGKIGGNEKGNYEWYYDLLPTNCVADWVCPGGVGSGYPGYAHRLGPEYGYRNLAVFMNNCNFNCLFCQNWQFREKSSAAPTHGTDELTKLVTDDTACVCFFGGDPTPQIEFIIKSTEELLFKKRKKILRICFETNGSMSKNYLERMINISLKTGGCIKFDLKAWNDNIHRGLCGVSNTTTLKNFESAARYIKKRSEPPLLIASTLLVPGYVDADEVRGIASFIAKLNPTIPYTLLAFHPNFFMDDLPVTSKKHMERCYEVAISCGLKRVRMGNFNLLGDEEY